MDFPDDGDFTFSFDHKDHAGEYAGEHLEKKVDSLGWKVTFISIIIPCLIAVVGVLAYFSITKKVNDFQHTGSETVQSFSQRYDVRLNDMQNNLAAQKESVDRELARISHNAEAVKSIRSEFKSISADFKTYQGSVKANQKSIKSLTAENRENASSVDGLRKDMEKLSSAVAEASRQLLALRQQLETVETHLAGLKDMTALKPDTETVRGMLNQFQKNLMPSVEAATRSVENELKALKVRIYDLERKMAVSSPGAEPVPPGEIVEENLR